MVDFSTNSSCMLAVPRAVKESVSIYITSRLLFQPALLCQFCISPIIYTSYFSTCCHVVIASSEGTGRLGFGNCEQRLHFPPNSKCSTWPRLCGT